MKNLIARLQDNMVTACLVALATLAGLATPFFWTAPNLSNILSQASIPAILAIGACFVVGSGQIDLSVGSLSALGGLVAVYIANGSGGLGPAVLATVVLGLCAGLFNGLFSRWLPSFIVSLGALGILRGLALTFSGSPIRLESPPPPSDFALAIGPAAAVVALAFLAMRGTRFGLNVLAVGSNRQAAANAGINVDIYRMMAFAISGVLASSSGALIAFRLGAGSPAAGYGYELDAIEAAIIGGAVLTGGRVSISGALAAAILFSTIRNSFTLMNYPSALQQVLTGVVLLVVVLVQRAGSKSST